MSEAIDKTTNAEEEAESSFSQLAEQMTASSKIEEGGHGNHDQQRDEDESEYICFDCLMNEIANSNLLTRIMKTQLDMYGHYKNGDAGDFKVLLQEGVRKTIYGHETEPAKD